VSLGNSSLNKFKKDAFSLFSAPLVTQQRTLKKSISCTGIGLHSGVKTTITLQPANVNTGIVFRRIDIVGGGTVIPALWSNVSDTCFNTCIANTNGISVHTTEHLMAALAGMGIDNVVIDINSTEVPIMDGSSAPFTFLIECAGIEEQLVPRRVLKILKAIKIQDGNRTAELLPDHGFFLHVEIDFPSELISHQECILDVNSNSFKTEISRARTFGFEQKISDMKAVGLGKGGSLDNAVIISYDGKKILNEDGLRYDDEFVRHKTIDALGDLSLAGAQILGRFHGVRCGHTMHNRLLNALFDNQNSWTTVELDAQVKFTKKFYSVRSLEVATS
jgi:UDP-3-O-[3-hydroxymyristoyl] N-acetylglucosamine deacetylase